MQTFIIAQIMSIINGLLLLKSMRAKDKKKFLIFNSTSNLFGSLSMVILGAYAASIGPIVLTIQGLLTHYYESKGKKIPKFLLPLCLGLNIFGGMLTFNSLLCLLPIISSSLASVMLASKNMKTTRRISLVSSIMALPYLITNKAYVAALIFGSNFINTLDAIYRIDYKETKKEEKEPQIIETLETEGQDLLEDIIKAENGEKEINSEEALVEAAPISYTEEQMHQPEDKPLARHRIKRK